MNSYNLLVMELSSDQQKALGAILEWHGSEQRKQFITVGGYAGTGKTTLISVIRRHLGKQRKHLKVAFVSYTGKAAVVLKTHVRKANPECSRDFIGTIHSLIYSPITNDREEITGWEKKEVIDCDLIVVDEASMVDKGIWEDLLSFGIPIIAVGDHGQLPPISGFFNLMEKPEITLEEIHRQAKGNPIILLSVAARTTGIIRAGKYGRGVRKYQRQDPEGEEELEKMLRSYDRDTLILCGLNATRVKVNGFIRNSLAMDPVRPQTHDRVICLRNNHSKEIFNGMLGTIQSIERRGDVWYAAKIMMDAEEILYKGLISVSQFNNPTSMNFTDRRAITKDGDLFDFGYALTVHKAQGSQAKKVVLFEERFSKMDDDTWSRWLYTGVTRAEEELYIFGY